MTPNSQRYIVMLIAVIVVLLSACTAKEQVRYDASTETRTKMGDVPSDVCFDFDGKPLILGVSMDEGDFVLSYVTQSGDLAAKMWLKTGVDNQVRERGTLIWDGTLCPKTQ